jgi:peptide methionine sulfoxide reductase msrA/msrB
MLTKKNFIILLLIVSVLLIIILIISNYSSDMKNKYTPNKTQEIGQKTEMPEMKKAYFAGGCFWCVEKDFEKLGGVSEVISGYMGGEQENPTYKDHADHRESVEVIYDPEILSYENLVQYLFRHIDPTDPDGSFYDRGLAYTSAIYPMSDEEERIAISVLNELGNGGIFPKPIVTAIESGAKFWIAEDYHQDYYKKNPIRYNAYRFASGRDRYIKSIWGDREDFEIVPAGLKTADDPVEAEEVMEGDTVATKNWSNFEKPSNDVLKNKLSEIAYSVTQKEKTERPFSDGNFDTNQEAGVYIDIVSGEPLFSSKDKFDSGTGWPSFSKPISDEYIVTKNDFLLIIPRTEVRSKYADSHLGHVFKDGPEPTGERWCMNGAAMDFIPLAEMESLGYGDYVKFVE